MEDLQHIENINQGLFDDWSFLLDANHRRIGFEVLIEGEWLRIYYDGSVRNDEGEEIGFVEEDTLGWFMEKVNT